MASKTEEKKEEYKNDLVQVVVHRKPNCLVEYEVEASKQICADAQKKAAREIGKQVVVPGFRKGKAPAEIVAKRYPHELDKRWQEAIANRSFQESAQLANVPLVRNDATISFKMESHSKERAKLTLSFETIPTIPTIDPAKCVLEEVKRPEVNKEKVEETIRQTQMFFAKWKPVEARPIKEGDFVIMDVDVIETDPPEKLFSNTRFEVVDKSMSQWMKELILGKKPGEVVEGTSIPDKSLSEEEKKEFPPKKVRLTLKSIEECDNPELDDAFAKQMGVEDIATLKTRVEALLNKKADEHVREIQREQVTDFLLSNDFDLPSSVVEKEVQFRLQQMIQDPKFKADWDISGENKRKELIDSVKNQAEKAVRIFYLCRKIASDQNMSVTPKDVPAAVTDPLEALLYPSAQPHDPRQPDVKQAEAYSKILLEKTEDWVIAHSRVGKAPKKKVAKKEPAKKEAAPKTAKKKAAAPKKAVKKTTTTKKAAAPKKKKKAKEEK